MAKKKTSKTTAKKAKTAAAKKSTKKATAKTAKKTAAKKSSKTSASKAAAKKKTTKKATGKAGGSQAKSAARKSTKQAAKKTAKKSSSAKSDKAKDKDAPAEETKQPKAKPKLSISIGSPKKKRPVAPGVRIADAPQSAPGTGETKDEKHKLSARDIRRIREILQEKRDTVLAEIRHQIGDSIGRMSSVAKDEADRAADVYDGDVSYEMAAAGQRELMEINAALEKIDKGTYGECESCGGGIGPSRLKVLPFATLCTACRQHAENGGELGDGDSIWAFLDVDAEDGGDN
ncbi:MAG: TraR/DksA family transcriptional regulator [Planctomycetota bacterium]